MGLLPSVLTHSRPGFSRAKPQEVQSGDGQWVHGVEETCWDELWWVRSSGYGGTGLPMGLIAMGHCSFPH